MRLSSSFVPTLVATVCLTVSGCSSSHSQDAGVPDGTIPPGCTGTAPLCYPAPPVDPPCCIDLPMAATCRDDRWRCRSDSLLASQCGIIDPGCPFFGDGGFGDGGPPPPPPLPYYACDATSDCGVRANTCCGTCGRPSADDMVAVNRDRAMDYYLDVACPEAREGPIACPGCVAGLNPNLVATCAYGPAGGMCSLLDIESDPSLAGCDTDADCVLSVPECCECGASTHLGGLIAINRARRPDLEALLCNPGWGCDACVPSYPDDAVALCDSGFCRVAFRGSMP